MKWHPGIEAEVGWLTERERTVKARCLICDRLVAVDLKRLMVALGPDFSLSNRRPRCRKEGCPGRVRFEDWSRMWPISLDTITDKDAAWWEMSDQMRSEAEAAGWLLEEGRWRAGAVPAPGVAK